MALVRCIPVTWSALCHVHHLGSTPYLDAWRLQERLAAQIAAGACPATLLLLEHPHTFTFGRQGRAGNLLWTEAQLTQRGVEVHWVDRGGDVTYHGPGQLVGYPLLPLGRVQDDGRLPRADYVGYIRRLEAALIRALSRFGVVSGQMQGLTGVWVQPDIASRCPRCPPAGRLAPAGCCPPGRRPERGPPWPGTPSASLRGPSAAGASKIPRSSAGPNKDVGAPPAARKAPSKIAAIGVKVDANGVSRHGFALNVSPAMSYWEGIIACGLADYPVISLAELLEQEPPMGEVIEAVVEAFGLEFGYTMEEADALDPVDGWEGQGWHLPLR